MKYWRGYIVAALLAALTWALTGFADAHRALVDMVYPYMTRIIQTTLSGWTAGVDFCLWQLIVVLLGVMVLASIILMIIFRWNPIQWFGWILTGASFLWLLHTGIYGLNNYAGDLADDIRLEVTEYTVSELAEATTYFRDLANELSAQVPRNADGTLDYPSFEELAQQAGNGFKTLTNEKYLSIFAGSTDPVKKLGWADLYTDMSIDGVTMALTGEAAVNPQIPAVVLPFTMCHEMAHRMCIATERDAHLSAFLACDANSDPIFRYSGYFMAFRYCYNALASVGTSASSAACREIYAGVCDMLKNDLTAYRAHYAENKSETATKLATSVNDTYLKASGNESGVGSYGEVTDLLVSWYIQEIYIPAHMDEVVVFDPMDKTQVDLSEPVATEGE